MIIEDTTYSGESVVSMMMKIVFFCWIWRNRGYQILVSNHTFSSPLLCCCL